MAARIVVPKMCAACGQIAGAEKFASCGHCRTTRYCSKVCQKEHWPKHKKCVTIFLHTKPKLQNFPLLLIFDDNLLSAFNAWSITNKRVFAILPPMSMGSEMLKTHVIFLVVAPKVGGPDNSDPRIFICYHSWISFVRYRFTTTTSRYV